ncbi:hypothetical protein DWW33_04265 [Roseburia sp. AF15-21]|uniref:hypothetical protein n=1 Tax=Roseburia sp. AF15-21 TaxID=2293128 RepID=UPI000E554B5E|nr:hypothetical protein [Roseburia sp. AF15-21]RHR89475.1 hypothetical protein DWW33_04265 [Roseburia sp. AF15-21]
MKLNKDDRIKYDDSFYAVVAVIWSTVYLRAIEDGTTNYDYEISEVYKTYRDVEFLGKKVN